LAWIESHDGIWEHHKTIRLCGLLGIGRAQAVGHLHGLWHFVLRNAWKDADLEAWGDAEIERAAFWEGEKGKFVSALREVKFIDGFVVHGWLERAGKLVMDRRYNEQRRVNAVKRRKSAFLRRKTEATQPNPTQPNHTIPNPTKDKGTPDKPPASPVPVDAPRNGDGTETPKIAPKAKSLTKVQRVVLGFKAVLGVEPEDKGWDSVYFRRYSRPALDLLRLFEDDVGRVADCIDQVSGALERRGLSWTPETIVKHAGDWKNGRLFK
jgi:hypothetical protein